MSVDVVGSAAGLLAGAQLDVAVRGRHGARSAVEGDVRVGEADGGRRARELGLEGGDEHDAVGCLHRLAVEVGGEAGVLGAGRWQLAAPALAREPEWVAPGIAEVAGAGTAVTASIAAGRSELAVRGHAEDDESRRKDVS